MIRINAPLTQRLCPTEPTCLSVRGSDELGPGACSWGSVSEAFFLELIKGSHLAE